MPRHSKNNTASGNFTYYERQKAGQVWGTSTSRLSSISQRAFDACTLCLTTARDPMSCSEGHLFCKECIYADLLAQKAEIERQKAALAALATKEEADRERALAEARERVLREFERQSVGLVSLSDGNTRSTIVEEAANPLKRKAEGPPSSGEEQKENGSSLQNLADRIKKKSEEAEHLALSKIQEEQAAARKDRKLPSFWLPELTPSERQDAFALGVYGKGAASAAEMELKTICKAGSERGHALNMKQLFSIKFHRGPASESTTMPPSVPSSEPESPAGATEKGQKSISLSKQESGTAASCPTCKNPFRQSSNIFLLRRCGHALCQMCVDTLILAPCKLSTAKLASLHEGKKQAKEGADQVPNSKGSNEARCAACEKKLKDLSKDIVPLQKEGTGFAASGNAQATKKGVAFQG